MSHEPRNIPAFCITLDGTDLTSKIAPRLVSLSLTEARSDDSDQLSLTLDDSDGQLAIPSRGVSISLHIGWQGQPLTSKGSFTVDEVEHSGSPDLITLTARSASFTAGFRQTQERSFHATTLGAILEIIAFTQQLSCGIADSLRNVPVAHIDQTRESDAAFLRRLGKRYDAAATIKNGVLLFVPASRSQTASGKTLPTLQLTRQLGDRHRYHSAERDSYSGVRAFWHDDRHGLRRSVIAGTSGNSKRLRTTYADESGARTAAVAEWQRIQRGLATFQLNLALGDPAIMPLSPVKVSGFKPAIDQGDWIVSRVVHSISDSGYTTAIEMETRCEEAEVEREEEVDPDAGVTGVVATWRNLVSKKTGREVAPSLGKGKKRHAVAGADAAPKVLPHVYASISAARQAVDKEWAKIVERREVMAENAEA